MAHTGHKGITLLDLLVALAVAGVLINVAVPSLVSMVLDARRVSRLNALVGGIHFARSEAIKRNGEIVLCRVSDTADCDHSSDDWGQGWILFTNLDQDQPPRRDDDEPLLRRAPAAKGATLMGNRRDFTFRAPGRRSSNGTLVYCDRRGAAAARALIVSYTGRPRVAGTRPDGSNLECP